MLQNKTCTAKRDEHCTKSRQGKSKSGAARSGGGAPGAVCGALQGARRRTQLCKSPFSPHGKRTWTANPLPAGALPARARLLQPAGAPAPSSCTGTVRGPAPQAAPPAGPGPWGSADGLCGTGEGRRCVRWVAANVGLAEPGCCRRQRGRNPSQRPLATDAGKTCQSCAIPRLSPEPGPDQSPWTALLLTGHANNAGLPRGAAAILKACHCFWGEK